MKNLLIILTILIVTAGCNYVPNGHVRVDFVNKSSKNIKSITLPIRDKTIENIKVGEIRTLTFKHSGEGTYLFTVNFESGEQLIENQRYIEKGYFITENIFDTIVKTNY